jgi:hypothetical protein
MNGTPKGGRRPLTADRRRWFVVALITLLPLSACQKSGSSEKAEEPPARVEAVPGSEFQRVTLSAKAAERLGIQTDRIVDGPGGSKRVIPYAAVLYDAKGAASAYTSPELRTFVRQRITVDRVDGDHAILSDGPTSGTVVVTVGAAELLGVESGVGEG